MKLKTNASVFWWNFIYSCNIVVVVLAEMIRKKLFKVQHSTDAELFCYPIVCAEVERHHVTEANYRTFLLVKTLMYVFWIVNANMLLQCITILLLTWFKCRCLALRLIFFFYFMPCVKMSIWILSMRHSFNLKMHILFC